MDNVEIEIQENIAFYLPIQKALLYGAETAMEVPEHSGEKPLLGEKEFLPHMQVPKENLRVLTSSVTVLSSVRPRGPQQQNIVVCSFAALR